MTSQQTADALLQQWQSLRAMPPDERIEALMAQFFLPVPETDILYELTMRRVCESMQECAQ